MPDGATGFAALAAAFRHRNFRIYAIGNALSLVGLWVQRVAVGWLTWELTRSGTWLGIMVFADLAPALLLGPIGGAIADRFDRKRIAMGAQALALVQAASLAALTMAGLIDIYALLAFTVALGAVSSFWQPVRLALMPALVERPDLPAAIAIASMIFNLARFVGPAVAGPIIVYAGVGPAFAVNAVSFLAFLVALAAMDLPRPKPRPRGGSSVLGDVMAGVRFAAAHAGIGPLLLLTLVVAAGVRPVAELLPGFADAVFDRGAGGLAMMTSALGLGALVGGLWLARRGDRPGLTRATLTGAALGGVAVAAFAATDVFPLALLAISGAGVAIAISAVGAQTLVQTAVPDEMRGRVLSFYGLIFRSAPALGALAMGAASEVVGLGPPVMVGAALGVAACAWGWRRRARLAAALEAAPA